MTFQPSAPHKRSRWLVLLAVVVLGTGMLATTAAAVTFNFVQDVDLANDEPGQKDLTADAAAQDGSTFYTAWKWDDTSWSGNNTGDACSLFNTDSDPNANYAVCVTIGKPAIETSTRAYSCSDNKADRCTGAVLEGTESSDSSANWCSVAPASAAFPPPPQGGDTQATCNITLIASDLGLSGLDFGTFLNSCSYPSQEPNSDPSDCVHRTAPTPVSAVTAPTATTTWSATLNDRVQLTPNTADGSVVFKLWDANESGVCTGLRWTSNSVALVNGFATSVGAGTASGSNVVTDATVVSDLTFYWTVEHTPTGNFVAAPIACGETTTITPASVSPNLAVFPAP